MGLFFMVCMVTIFLNTSYMPKSDCRRKDNPEKEREGRNMLGEEKREGLMSGAG